MNEKNPERQDTTPLENGADIGLHEASDFVLKWGEIKRTIDPIDAYVKPEQLLSPEARTSLVVLSIGTNLRTLRSYESTGTEDLKAAA